MTRAARLLTAGTLIEAVSLAPLAWRLATGDLLTPEVWRLAAAVGLSGAALQLVTLTLCAARWGRRTTRP